MNPNIIQKILIKILGHAKAETHWMPFGNIEKPISSFWVNCNIHGYEKSFPRIDGRLYCTGGK